MVARRQECRQPHLERLQVGPQQRGLQALDQVLQRQERLRLRGAEPEAGELVRMALDGFLRLEAITVLLAVPDDGRVKTIAQVLEVALEGGERHIQLLEESRDRHYPRPARLEELVDLVEALGTVHGEFHARTMRD